MSYTRTLCNETNLTLDVTLYIQAGSDPSKLYGTLNVLIPSMQSMDIAYGDLRNSFLSGLRVCPSPADPLDALHCRVIKSGDDIAKWLNGYDTLYLNADRLMKMESAAPISWLNAEVVID